jgi:hypothetical protein
VFCRLLGICCAALLFTAGCNGPDRKNTEVITVITTRAAALNSRDLPRYLSVVSLQYNDKGKSFARLKESLEKNFRDFEELSYEADPPNITIDGTRAEAVSNYRMKVRVRGREIALNGIEHLRLAKEPGGWKIIAGI